MKGYGIPTFGQKQNNIVVILKKLGLLKVEKARQYSDPITEKPMVTLVYVKTFYPVARLLTWLFINGRCADDICKNNLASFERLGENNEEVEHLILYCRTRGKVFESQ